MSKIGAYNLSITSDDMSAPDDEQHSRFDADHRSRCQECYEAALDFIMEQADDEYLDAMASEDEARA